MKTIITAALLLIASVAFASTSTITFGITSSAATASPNLRIAMMKRVLVNAPISVQSFVWDETANYKLTKTQATSYSGTNYLGILVQTDQDTKTYLGADLTNYILIQSGVDKVILFRP